MVKHTWNFAELFDMQASNAVCIISLRCCCCMKIICNNWFVELGESIFTVGDFFIFGGTDTASICSSHTGSSLIPADLPLIISSVHSLRCFVPYLHRVPRFSRSFTNVTWMSFHDSLSALIFPLKELPISSRCFLLFPELLVLSGLPIKSLESSKHS